MNARFPVPDSLAASPGPYSVLVCASSLALIALAARPASAASNSNSQKPFNVLFIMVDQQNIHALGAYDSAFGGLDQSMTPNLDRLAEEGVLFENAVCSTPQCCPSRFSVLTGRWPHNHGLRWNTVWEPRNNVTFPTLARAAGYGTATIGKHHLYWLDQQRPLVEDHGFDLVLDLDDYSDFCSDNGMDIYIAPGNQYSMPNMPALLEGTGYTFNDNGFHPAGYWADQVIEFIDEQSAEGETAEPFVCWYSMVGPHSPIMPSGPADPHDWAHMYHPFSQLPLPANFDKDASTGRLLHEQSFYAGMSDAEHREVLSYYYGLVTQIDYNIGRVLDRLDELGIADETLVIYTADHGEMAAEMSCWAKGGGVYDALVRIPLIVRLPGVLPAGRVVSEVVNNVDLFPTMIELTGVPIPDDVRQRVDGRSLMPLMSASPAPADWPEETFCEFGPQLRGSNEIRMVRTGDMKFSFDEWGDDEELYDLAADPFEIVDLMRFTGTEPPEAADLRARLDAWWNDATDHAPAYDISGNENAQPSVADGPSPEQGGDGAHPMVDPGWVPSTAAQIQRVYFGTDAGSLSLFATVGPMVSSFNPGSLDLFTTYYWRVDSSNDHGMTTGPIWNFRTRSFGPIGPGLSTGADPAHGEQDVTVVSRLRWSGSPDADFQRVYLGLPGEDLTLLAHGTPVGVTEIDPGDLSAGTTYQWRVDQIGPDGTTEGDLWSFRTDPTGLAQRAGLPSPKHMAKRVPPINGWGLCWQPGPGALSHDVYLGTSFPLEFQGNQTGTRFSPTDLEPGQTYYWRIDEVNNLGRTVGFTWRFTFVGARPRVDPR